MAIDQGTETLAISVEERSWRLEIFTEKGDDPTVRVHRETIKSSEDGSIIARERGVTVERALSSVASDSFQIGGKTYTGAEIANILSVVADIWRQQDIDAAVAGDA